MLKTLGKLVLQNKLWSCLVMGTRHSCEIPAIVMNNGNEMPILGFGTWSSTDDFANLEKPKDGGKQKPAVKDSDEKIKANSEIVAKSVGLAIDAGYTHIDCAHLYKNEKEIGTALKKKIKSGAITRDKLFITSKLWNTFHDPENVCAACSKSLNDLDLEYLDMYLMHSPMGFQHGEDFFPMCDDNKPAFTEVDYLDTWKAMEELVENKMCKNIGISNFNQDQIERLLKNCKIVPQTLQMELHPYLRQNDLIHYAKCNDICITAYAPLGSPKRPWASQDNDLVLLKDYKILYLAEKHKRTPAQIILRYQIQIGHAAIPKSTDRKRIQDNINIFDFELCPEDITNIESVNHNLRYFRFSGANGHPNHPFENLKKKSKC